MRPAGPACEWAFGRTAMPSERPMAAGREDMGTAPPPGSPARAGALGPLRVLLLASVLLPMALFGAVAWKNYLDVKERAIERTARLAQSVREHALKVFETNEVLMGRVDDLIAGRDDAEIRRDEGRLHERLSGIAEGIPHVQAIWAWGRDGRALASSRFHPVAPDLDIRDRQYFQVHRDGIVGAYVTEPLGGRISAETFFGISRRRSSPDGAFAGLVAVSLRPDYFTDFYRRIAETDQGLTITMARDDGVVIVRHPAPPEPGARLSPESVVMRAVREGRMGEPLWVRSQLDGIERLVTVQRIGTYPLHMGVGLPYGAILSEWYANLALYGIFAAAAAAALFATTWVALRRFARERMALAARDDEARRREHAEEALRQAQKLEALGQLTGGVAHDFNNLLTVVVANLDMIDRRAENPAEVRRMAGTAIAAASRGARLTQQLLAFARRQALQPQVVEVNRALLEIEPLLRQAIGMAVRLEFALDPDLRHCRIDLAQFENAVLNLVVNARDAMPSGGRLVVGTRNAHLAVPEGDLEAGDYLVVSVADTGSGIPPEVLPRIFEPFFTTKDVGRGSGLGLSQVYGFVRQSGGEVRLESRPGEGTTVRLFLRCTSEEPSGAATATAAADPAARGEAVLVVEDDEDVRAVAVGTLRDLGYRVLTAVDGMAAMEILQGPERIDLLFSDVVMPRGLDGVTLAREAERLRPGIRILLTSGYTAQALARDHGVENRYRLLAKPYRSAGLAAKLREILAQQDVPSSPEASRSLRVLLVEDEALVRMSVSDMLVELGHEVMEAESADEALLRLRTAERVDVLITDVGLPDMDGRELAAVAVDLMPGLPVVLATGYAERRDAARDTIPATWLHKPYYRDDLKRVLAAIG
jgi:signal transduction histidine kinase/response regulator RpfG family c-di-GMP phosphodiesterase